MSVETEIANAMLAYGITPPTTIVFDGKIHRFATNKSSWYAAYSSPVAVCVYGDWKTGVNEKYVESRQDVTPKDRQWIAQQMREAVAQREAELKASYEQAASETARIWNNAGTAGMNGYLASKSLQRPVDEYGLRQGQGPFLNYKPFGTSEVSLIVPASDIGGATWSLQIIANDGRKRFYPGGKLHGHFCPIGLQGEPEKILIAEGVATALTLREDTGLPVITAFNANNLVPVAESIRWKYASVDILICGDDDHATEGNPGRTKAIEAAARCGGDWVLPDFSGLPRGEKDTDFNDLRQLRRCAA